MPWLLDNRFIILSIEEYEENIDLLDIFISLPYIVTTSSLCWPRWEKKLSFWSTISTLDACGNYLHLPISLETTNTSKSFIVYILVDFGTIGVFIKKSFVEKHCLHIHKLSKAVLIYNIDRISNKASQISKVVDVILYYQICAKQILLIVFSSRKQDLILRFIWLKQHSLEMD